MCSDAAGVRVRLASGVLNVSTMNVETRPQESLFIIAFTIFKLSPC